MREYSVVLTPDPEGGFVVTVPSLPGCVTEGDSMEEAIEMARDAIRLWIESLEALGEPVPEEQAHPELATIAV